MEQPILIESERKTDVLKRVRFGCLTGKPAMNFTVGCLHSCIYCYAKGYPSSPPDGQVIFYTNTRRLLEKKIRKKPQFVVLNTASDSFQPHPMVLEMAYECMEILIKNRVPFSFLTKGSIPEEFFDLFKKAPSLIHAHIGLTTLNDGKRFLFEPFSAPVESRLRNIENLIECGIIPSVRVDPIIPLHMDSDENFHTLFKRISEIGVKEASISVLHIRCGIVPFLLKRLGRIRWKKIEEYFEKDFITLCGGTRARLVKKEFLDEIYKRAISAGKIYGIDVKICSCKNPSFSSDVCPSGKFGTREPSQLILFSKSLSNGEDIHARHI